MFYHNASEKPVGVMKNRSRVILQPGDEIELTAADLVQSGLNRGYLKAKTETPLQIMLAEQAAAEKAAEYVVEKPEVYVAEKPPVWEPPVVETKGFVAPADEPVDLPETVEDEVIEAIEPIVLPEVVIDVVDAPADVVDAPVEVAAEAVAEVVVEAPVAVVKKGKNKS